MAGKLTISTLNDSSGVLATQNGMTGIAKAWVNYNGVAQTVRASFNVSSVTYVSSGVYTLNFTTAMADSNYMMTFGCGPGNGRTLQIRTSSFNDTVGGVTAAVQTTTQVQINEIDFAGTSNNSTFIFAAVFGN